MNTVHGRLAEAVSQALGDGVEDVEPREASELFSIVHWMQLRRPGDGIGTQLAQGPLKTIAEVTRETVRAGLERSRAVRAAVDVPRRADPATSLLAALNVLLASDAALHLERRYAYTERAAMVGASITELRGDAADVAAHREALTRAARDALEEMRTGIAPYEGSTSVVSASELIRADLVARLRGEITTSAMTTSKLTSIVRFLVDTGHEKNNICGPLWQGPPASKVHSPLAGIRDAVFQRLHQLHTARREVTRELGWPRNPNELGEVLAKLLLVVLAGDAADTVARTYAAAEAQVMAAATIAQLRGDTKGIAIQKEILQNAAATALHQLGDPNAPVEPKMVEDLLHAQLA